MADVIFKYRIDGGPEGEVRQASGLYSLAAVAAVAQQEHWSQTETGVEVWCEHLLPEYGPYVYVVWFNESGALCCATAIRVRAAKLRLVGGE